MMLKEVGKNNKDIKACCLYLPDPTQIDNYYACFNAFDGEDNERTIVTSSCDDRVISDSTQIGTHGKVNTSKVLEDEEKDTIFGFVPVSGERDTNQHVPTVNTKPQGTEIHKNHGNFVVRNSADLTSQIETPEVRNQIENRNEKIETNNRERNRTGVRIPSKKSYELWREPDEMDT